MYTVREMSEKDRKGVLELIAEFKSFIKGMRLGGKLVRAKDCSIDPAQKYYVAEHEEKVVGYGCYFEVNWADEKKFISEEIYISPLHRKKGLAKMIFQAISDRALVTGATAVITRVDPRNIGMLDVARSLGFQVIEVMQLRLDIGQLAEEKLKNHDRAIKIFGREFRY